jgi:tetrahydromethanopterin S-methyltransferase subunit F
MHYKIIFLIFAMLGMFGYSQTNFISNVNRNKVGLNEQFTLTFTLNDRGEQFRPPNLSNFSIISGPSTSSSTSIINGKMTRENTYSYKLRANKKGIFTIGPASINANNKLYSSKKISIQVLNTTPKTKNNSPESRARKNVFLKLELSNNTPYVGEQITASFNLYFSQEIRSPELLETPNYNGFWHEDYDLGDTYPINDVQIDGIDFKVATIKKIILIPQRSGNLTISSFDIDVPVAIPSNQRDIFGRRRSKMINVVCSSGNKNLLVKELPEKDKPINFDGAVGEFQFTTRLDRDSIQTNESATLSMRISGTGNMRMINLPKAEIPNDLEAYEPKFTDKINLNKNGLNGFKRVEYLLIPRNNGKYKVSSEQFSYFNPKRKKYIQINSPNYTLNVSGANTSKQEGSMMIYNKEDVTFIGKDILYIKTNTQLKNRNEGLFFGSLMFGVLGIGMLVYVILLLLIIFLLKKSILNISQIIKKNHSKQAMKLLDKEKSELYFSIEQSLQFYFESKWNLGKVQFNKEFIKQTLQLKKVDIDLIIEISNLLEVCEMARFTNKKSHGSDKESLIMQTKSILQKLEYY